MLIYNLKPVQGIVGGNDEEGRRGEDDTGTDESYESSATSDDGSRVTFRRVLSSASCNLADIQNFIVGGGSSRFWMLRKHINDLPRHLFKKLPLFAWNCITL